MPVKTKPYESQATTVKISATSRMSMKLGDSFYTFEFMEEREILPEFIDDSTFDIEKERALLWDLVNAEVDKQAEEVYELMKRK